MNAQNLPVEEGSNIAALDNLLAKSRHEHGQQCLHDQEYSKAYAQTIKAQKAVQEFNRALFEMKKQNPSHAVVALLTYELGMAVDEQIIERMKK